jgi:hypothetical protein
MFVQINVEDLHELLDCKNLYDFLQKEKDNLKKELKDSFEENSKLEDQIRELHYKIDHLTGEDLKTYRKEEK